MQKVVLSNCSLDKLSLHSIAALLSLRLRVVSRKCGALETLLTLQLPS